MKKGRAKFDAGIRPKVFQPADGGDAVIRKGRIFYVPDDYNFKAKSAIFEEVKETKEKKEL